MKNQNEMMVTGGGVLLALGSFLAWGTVNGIGNSGIDVGDGWMTLVAGVVVAAYGFAAYQEKSFLPKWLGWAAVIVGLGIAILNLIDIAGTDGVSIGIGMWLMLLGGAVAIVGLLRKA